MMIGMYRRGTRRPHLGLRFVLAICLRFVLAICLRFVLAICLRFVLVLCLKCPDAGHITPSPAHKSYFLTP
jgi:hypothetical protein